MAPSGLKQKRWCRAQGWFAHCHDSIYAINRPKNRHNHIERATIEKALTQTQQNKTAAAKLLGISFRALRYKLEKLGIE